MFHLLGSDDFRGEKHISVTPSDFQQNVSWACLWCDRDRAAAELQTQDGATDDFYAFLENGNK